MRPNYYAFLCRFDGHLRDRLIDQNGIWGKLGPSFVDLQSKQYSVEIPHHLLTLGILLNGKANSPVSWLTTFCWAAVGAPTVPESEGFWCMGECTQPSPLTCEKRIADRGCTWHDFTLPISANVYGARWEPYFKMTSQYNGVAVWEVVLSPNRTAAPSITFGAVSSGTPVGVQVRSVVRNIMGLVSQTIHRRTVW